MTTRASSHRLPKAPRKDEVNDLLAGVRSLRNRAMILIMAGCGLRVSEVCNLTLDQVHWSTDTPSLRFSGKGGKERVVPLNLEVQDTLRRWLEVRGTNHSPYLFPSQRTGGRLDRRAVWIALKRLCRRGGIRHVHPHSLRHFFGTQLADRQVPIERIRELMGHSSITTSQIYIAVSAEQKRSAVERLDGRSRFTRWLSRLRNRTFRFFGPPRQGLVFGVPQTVGRRAEFQRLQQNVVKRISTLLVGPVGAGKSHLLGLLQGERLIHIKTLNPVRQAVINIAADLHTQGRFGAEDFEIIKKRHARASVPEWAKLVLDAVEKDQWTLVIDDLSDMTATTGRLIAQLSHKFVIVSALHEVKKPHEKYFWKFDRVTVANLPKADAQKLIRQCASGADIEDFQLLETQVLQQSAGSPRAIIESVERLRREPAITRQAVRELSPTGARKHIDLTPAILIPIVALVAIRFIARGLGDNEAYILAGIASAIAMGAQFLLQRLRR